MLPNAFIKELALLFFLFYAPGSATS